MDNSELSVYHIQNPYVLMLGISKYKSSDNLPGVEKDVTNMATLFKHYTLPPCFIFFYYCAYQYFNIR